MRKLVTILGLQAYAAVLAWAAMLGGIRTDEAKYLLNIPYPHPPLARAVLSLTEGMAGSELFWRLVFATLMVQSVWLVVRLPSKHAGAGYRLLLAASWLLSGAVVLQAGSIMMAPLTALCGLGLLLAAARRRSAFVCFLAALLWFGSVFVAYQSVLWLPVVLAVCIRSRQPPLRTFLYAFGPLAALALYTFTNPLALQSIAGLGADKLPLADAARETGLALLVAGSVVFLPGALAGLTRPGRAELPVTFVLVALYILSSYHAYYAVFFTPLIAAALAHLVDTSPGLHRRVELCAPLGVGVALGCIAAGAAAFATAPRANLARDTMAVAAPQIRAIDRTDVRMLIVGDFGHEWQYYAPPIVKDIVKYAPDLTVKDADVVVCWHACDASLLVDKERVTNAPVETWIGRTGLVQI